MRCYSRSSTRTPSAPANRRAVLWLAMRRSSSKSEMESADTPVLAESSRGLIPRSSRTRLSCCSSGIRNVYPSGRPDNRGRAGTEAAAGFRGVSLIGFRDADEKRDVVIDEREEGVDIARGELVEAVLARLVEKRHDRRVTDGGEG